MTPLWSSLRPCSPVRYLPFIVPRPTQPPTSQSERTIQVHGMEYWSETESIAVGSVVDIVVKAGLETVSLAHR